MTPKQRYGVLHEVIGDPWLWFTVTASDQVHYVADRADALEATPESPTCSRQCCRYLRQLPGERRTRPGRGERTRNPMGEIHNASDDTASLHGPTRTGRSHRSVCLQPWLVRSRNGVYAPADGTFDQWLERDACAFDAGDTALEHIFDEFPMHEHYI